MPSARSMWFGVLVWCVVCAAGVRGQSCTTPQKTRGECISLLQCAPLLNIFKLRALDKEHTTYLQQSQCGYENKTPTVCCEPNSEACKTPDNQPGMCTSIRTCNSLLNVLESSPFLGDNVVEYLKKSECPNSQGDNAKVCCPFVERELMPVKNRANLLPNESECGSHLFENKISGGNITDIYQYPWMALLEYDGIDGTELACGGSLISERYVLTAAHCIMGPNTRKGKLARVRLGEYDTNNDTDCKYFAYGETECMDPVVQVDVESTTVHEQFNVRNRQNDIALIRLKDPVAYTDFVKPICLPKTSTNLPSKLTVAGWGTTEAGRPSNLKLEVQVPTFNKNNCTSLYRRSNVVVGDNQLCAGGEFGKDSCGGDSGGPLMTAIKMSNGFYWFQIGVVSFGPTPCAREGIPAVYTLVWRYYDWIVNNMRP